MGRRMKLPIALSCLLLGVALPTEAGDQVAPKVIKSQRGGDFAFVALLVPRNEFNQDTVTSLARNYLMENRSTRLLKLTFYSDEKAATSEFDGKGTFHPNPDKWRAALREKMESPQLPLAEVVKINRSATLRIISEKGDIKEIPLQGPNVFHSTIQGHNLHLLYFASNWLIIDAPPKQLTASLFYRSDSCLSQRAAQQIADSLVRTAGSDKISVHISPDSLFLLDPEYPTYNSFDTRSKVPSNDELSKAWEIACGPSHKFQCSPMPTRASCTGK